VVARIISQYPSDPYSLHLNGFRYKQFGISRPLLHRCYETQSVVGGLNVMVRYCCAQTIDPQVQYDRTVYLCFYVLMKSFGYDMQYFVFYKLERVSILSNNQPLKRNEELFHCVPTVTTV
jgi:hypothetical protein